MKAFLHPLVPTAAAVMAGFVGAAHAQVHPYPQVALDGDQEAHEVVTDGSGVMDAVYNESSGAIYWYVDYTLDTDSTTMSDAHFHGPAPVGVGAGVRLGLGPGSIPSFPMGQSGIFRGAGMVNPDHRDEVLDELWYINLHSDQYPPGELRGQLIASPFTHYFDSDPIDPDQEVGSVDSNAFGTIDAAYDANTRRLTWGLKWQDLTGSITGMHFHSAPPGVNGGIVVDFATVGSFPTTQSGAFAGSVVLSEALESQLLAGNFYVNIHTPLHGPGEIRGQLNPIEVSVPVLGDINGDGVVNVADVTELANLIAAGTPPDVDVGDINDDGEVDELDIQALAEMIVQPPTP